MTVKELKGLLDAYEDNDEVRLQYQDESGYCYGYDGEITDVYTKLNRVGERYVLIF